MAKFRFFRFYLLIVFLFCSSYAHAKLKVEIVDRSQKQAQTIDWPFESEWVWKKLKGDSVETFYHKITVQAPDDLRISTAKGKRAKVLVDKSKTSFEIYTQDTLSLVYLKTSNGKILRWLVKVPVKDQFLFVENCETYNLYFKPLDIDNIDAFFGAKCLSENNNVILQLSVSPRVQWLTTSMAETQGKGESVRVFEVKSDIANADKTNVVGEFQLQYKKQKIPLELFFRADKRNYARFRTSLGYMQHDLTIENGASSSAGIPILGIAYSDRLSYEKIRYGFDLMVSLPALEKNNFVKYSQVNSFAGFTFGMSGSWWFETKASLQLSDGISQPASFFYNVNFFGGAINIKKIFQSGNEAYLEVASGTNGQESQLNATIRYAFHSDNPEELGDLSWGFSLGYESITLDSTQTADVNQINAMIDFYL